MTIGGIMAGGSGTRLRSTGIAKALLPVGGRPLVIHTLEQFRAAGIAEIVVETRAEDTDLIDLLQNYCGDGMTIELVHAPDGLGTGTSLRCILSAVQGEECMVSTVDTIAPGNAYAQLRLFADSHSSKADIAILATTFIFDESPIWVHTGLDSSIVTDFGKAIAPATRCFGNVRWLSVNACRDILGHPRSVPERDTILMGHIIRGRAGRVKQLTVNPIFDIDTPADVEMAERWLEHGRATIDE